jgi:hypothetical protein
MISAVSKQPRHVENCNKLSEDDTTQRAELESSDVEAEAYNIFPYRVFDPCRKSYLKFYLFQKPQHVLKYVDLPDPGTTSKLLARCFGCTNIQNMPSSCNDFVNLGWDTVRSLILPKPKHGR